MRKISWLISEITIIALLATPNPLGLRPARAFIPALALINPGTLAVGATALAAAGAGYAYLSKPENTKAMIDSAGNYIQSGYVGKEVSLLTAEAVASGMHEATQQMLGKPAFVTAPWSEMYGYIKDHLSDFPALSEIIADNTESGYNTASDACVTGAASCQAVTDVGTISFNTPYGTWMARRWVSTNGSACGSTSTMQACFNAWRGSNYGQTYQPENTFLVAALSITAAPSAPGSYLYGPIVASLASANNYAAARIYCDGSCGYGSTMYIQVKTGNKVSDVSAPSIAVVNDAGVIDDINAKVNTPLPALPVIQDLSNVLPVAVPNPVVRSVPVSHPISEPIPYPIPYEPTAPPATITDDEINDYRTWNNTNIQNHYNTQIQNIAAANPNEATSQIISIQTRAARDIAANDVPYKPKSLAGPYTLPAVDFGARFTQFMDLVKASSIFGLPDALKNVPGGGESQFIIEGGETFGVHVVDLADMNYLWVVLRSVVLCGFSFAAIRVVVLKGGGE